jgi:hypothetical protein
MLLNDRVLVELQKHASSAMGHRGVQESQQASVRIHGVFPNSQTKLTDQDDVFGALVLILQLADVKIRIIRRLEHISPPLLPALKVRGRHDGFLQQRWA